MSSTPPASGPNHPRAPQFSVQPHTHAQPTDKHAPRDMDRIESGSTSLQGAESPHRGHPQPPLASTTEKSRAQAVPDFPSQAASGATSLQPKLFTQLQDIVQNFKGQGQAKELKTFFTEHMNTAGLIALQWHSTQYPKNVAANKAIAHAMIDACASELNELTNPQSTQRLEARRNAIAVLSAQPETEKNTLLQKFGLPSDTQRRLFGPIGRQASKALVQCLIQSTQGLKNLEENLKVTLARAREDEKTATKLTLAGNMLDALFPDMKAADSDEALFQQFRQSAQSSFTKHFVEKNEDWEKFDQTLSQSWTQALLLRIKSPHANPEEQKKARQALLQALCLIPASGFSPGNIEAVIDSRAMLHDMISSVCKNDTKKEIIASIAKIFIHENTFQDEKATLKPEDKIKKIEAWNAVSLFGAALATLPLQAFEKAKANLHVSEMLKYFWNEASFPEKITKEKLMRKLKALQASAHQSAARVFRSEENHLKRTEQLYGNDASPAAREALQTAQNHATKGKVTHLEAAKALRQEPK